MSSDFVHNYHRIDYGWLLFHRLDLSAFWVMRSTSYCILFIYLLTFSLDLVKLVELYTYIYGKTSSNFHQKHYQTFEILYPTHNWRKKKIFFIFFSLFVHKTKWITSTWFYGIECTQSMKERKKTFSLVNVTKQVHAMAGYDYCYLLFSLILSFNRIPGLSNNGKKVYIDYSFILILITIFLITINLSYCVLTRCWEQTIEHWAGLVPFSYISNTYFCYLMG